MSAEFIDFPKMARLSRECVVTEKLDGTNAQVFIGDDGSMRFGSRTRRSTLQLLHAHVASSGHRVCNCGGYHYAHRPGSPYCVRNPASDLWIAQRQGESPEVLRGIAEHLDSPAARRFIDTFLSP